LPESVLGRIWQGDPLARAFSRLHLSPFEVVLAVGAYGVVHALALPAVFGHLRTTPGIPGTLDDWPNLVIILLMTPPVIGYYAWQPAIIQSMYDGISARVGRSPAAAARAAEFLRPLQWPIWAVVAAAVGALECWSWTLDLRYSARRTWENANGLMMASIVPLRFLVFYAIVFVLVRQVVVLIGLNRFFSEFAVKIQPIHPDRAGGPRVLGDYVLTNGMLIAVLGLILGMELLRVRVDTASLTPEFYGELVAYFAVAPTVILLPLLSAHTRRGEAKQKLMAEIAEQFDLEYRVLLDGLRRDELKLENVQQLEAIQKIYPIAEASPDWPFNLGIRSKFGATVLLPVLVPLGVDLVANVLLK
jgi:hypothetical protein